MEFARDAYADTGCSLLDSIAIVHPFIISAIVLKTRDNIGVAGEVCVSVSVCLCVQNSKYVCFCTVCRIAC